MFGQRFYKVQRLLLPGAAALIFAACGQSSAAEPSHESEHSAVPKPVAEIIVPPRTPALQYYPCAECHQNIGDEPTGTTNPHATIRMDHMPGGAECQTCHSKVSPAFLHLANGRSVSLNDAHKLCGQCHSKQSSDWELGIHGKQVGNWRGVIHRYACASCHNPHQPAFGTMASVPPPPFPALGIKKKGH